MLAKYAGRLAVKWQGVGPVSSHLMGVRGNGGKMVILASQGHLVPGPRAPRLWQIALRDAIRTIDSLCVELELDPALLGYGAAAARRFPLLVPRPFVNRMRRRDPHDPLLRQVLPAADEDRPQPDFLADPVADQAAIISPGLLHKYEGRALVVATGACAIHCRYCFRQNFDYAGLPSASELADRVAEAVASDPEISEVILSGGDPLTLADDRLADLAERLAELPQLRRLRVHSRLPIVLPQRVEGELIAWLTGTRLTPIMVVHANHPAEIDADVAAALARLIDAGVPVLNQAVLLRGVNDDVSVLVELCERLIDLRVMPYYLHQLDRVAGAARFEVPPDEARAIIQALRARLPGYAVPRLVQELPGATSKLPLA